jgi:hypothetical protein
MTFLRFLSQSGAEKKACYSYTPSKSKSRKP